MGRDGQHESSGAWFSATQWHLVWTAKDTDSAVAREGRNHLCQAYWAPVYAFLRRSGRSAHDAQDLTQEFFARFFEKNCLSSLTHQDGKFRSFLLTVLKRFLSDQRDKAGALKRGGAHVIVSLDAYLAEEQGALAPDPHLSPDEMYERRWAQAVMDEAARRLREEYRARDKLALYLELNNIDPGKHGPRGYAEIGASLGMSEQAVKNAVHAMRRRYGGLLREVIAQTVRDPAEVDAEIKYLMRVLDY